MKKEEEKNNKLSRFWCDESGPFLTTLLKYNTNVRSYKIRQSNVKKTPFGLLRCCSSESAASGQSGRHERCLLLQDPFGPKARRLQLHTSTYAVTAGGLRRCVWGASCRTSWRTPAGSESTGPGWSHQGGASLSASVSERRRKKRKSMRAEKDRSSALIWLWKLLQSRQTSRVHAAEPAEQRGWAHFYLRDPIPGTQRQEFTQQAGAEAHRYTSPVVFCPIRCRIITLCTIILLNLTRIKHASHKGHIYMQMPRQHSAGGDEI